MKSEGIRVRPANHSDSDPVLKWRNDPQSRLYSRNPDVISPEVHEVWFQALLGNTDRHLFIGEVNGELLGQVRFDLVDSNQATFEVSIALDSEMRGQGLAVPLLLAAESAFLDSTPVTALRAYVNSSNAASQNLFQRAGYSIEGSAESESNWWVKEINV